MSHSVTIRTQTVTTSSSAIIINTGYLKSWSGLLKVLELVLGIVCVGMMGYLFDHYFVYNVYQQFLIQASLFYFLIVTTFMIATFILLLSFTASISTESILTKTIFELIYHGLACLLLLIAAAILFFKVDKHHSRPTELYNLLLASAICALINSALYLLSVIIAFRSYRGL